MSDVLTEDQNFVNAFRYAVSQGHMVLRMTNYSGWKDDCDCARCRSQRIVFDFVKSITTPAAQPQHQGDGATGPAETTSA